MTVSLKYLEIENFKSFRGKVVIGPFRRFTCVVGCDEAGKSNLMDAIAFVLGVELGELPTPRLDSLEDDLIIHKGDSNICIASVTAVIETNSDIRKFTRKISTGCSDSDYFINGVHVTSEKYLEDLASLELNARARNNFLVFENTLEKILFQDSKTLTALFEEFSGSAEFEGEYNICKYTLQQKETIHQVDICMQQFAECLLKENLFDKKLLEEHVGLTKSLEENDLQLFYFKWLYNETVRERFQNELAEKRDEISGLRHILNEAEKAYSKEEADKASDEDALLEVDKIKSDKIFENRKKHTAILSLKYAQKDYGSREKEILSCEYKLKEVENELVEVLQQCQEFENELAEVLQQCQEPYESQEENKEYERLKRDVRERAALNKLWCSQVQNKQSKQDGHNKQQDRQIMQMEETKREILDEIEDTKKQRHNIASQLKQFKDELLKHEQGLDSVREQLVEVRKKETLQKLKAVFSGVYGRLIDLLTPKTEDAALMSIKENLDAIVVDTERTAKLCIAYLKDVQLAHETFLPLDTLRVRKIGNHPLLGLLPFDLHDIDPPETKKAILFALEYAYQNDCTASRDGTIHHKPAIISNETPDSQKGAKEASDQRELLQSTKMQLKKSIMLSRRKLTLQEREFDTLDPLLQLQLEHLENYLRSVEESLQLYPRTEHQQKEENKNKQESVKQIKEKIIKLREIRRKEHINETEFRELCSEFEKEMTAYEREVQDLEKKKKQIEMNISFNREIQRYRKNEMNDLHKTIKVIEENFKELTEKEEEKEKTMPKRNLASVQAEKARKNIKRIKEHILISKWEISFLKNKIKHLKPCLKHLQNDWKIKRSKSISGRASTRRLLREYSHFKEENQSVEENQITSKKQELKNNMDQINMVLKSLNYVNFKVKKDLSDFQKNFEDARREYTHSHEAKEAALTDFNFVVKKRHDSFMKYFESVCDKVEKVYKEMTGSTEEKTEMTLLLPKNSNRKSEENNKELYLKAIFYHNREPQKNWQPIYTLSPGVHTIGSLALYLALESCRQQSSPLLVFDTLDADLANTNIRNLGRFFSETSQQIIMITMREDLCIHAETVVNIISKGDIRPAESQALTLDMAPWHRF